jgi:hypothetical protein
MSAKQWFLGLTLSLVTALPVNGEVVRGVLAVRGAEMS